MFATVPYTLFMCNQVVLIMIHVSSMNNNYYYCSQQTLGLPAPPALHQQLQPHTTHSSQSHTSHSSQPHTSHTSQPHTSHSSQPPSSTLHSSTPVSSSPVHPHASTQQLPSGKQLPVVASPGSIHNQPPNYPGECLIRSATCRLLVFIE